MQVYRRYLHLKIEPLHLHLILPWCASNSEGRPRCKLDVIRVVPLSPYIYISLFFCGTFISVTQAKFQDYLAMSDSFLTSSIEKDSNETLPVVRRRIYSGRVCVFFVPARLVLALLVE